MLVFIIENELLSSLVTEFMTRRMQDSDRDSLLHDNDLFNILGCNNDKELQEMVTTLVTDVLTDGWDYNDAYTNLYCELSELFTKNNITYNTVKDISLISMTKPKLVIKINSGE